MPFVPTSTSDPDPLNVRTYKERQVAGLGSPQLKQTLGAFPAAMSFCKMSFIRFFCRVFAVPRFEPVDDLWVDSTTLSSSTSEEASMMEDLARGNARCFVQTP